jgi:hypothetical protein
MLKLSLEANEMSAVLYVRRETVDSFTQRRENLWMPCASLDQEIQPEAEAVAATTAELLSSLCSLIFFRLLRLTPTTLSTPLLFPSGRD